MNDITKLVIVMLIPVLLFGCELMGPEQGTRLKVYAEVPQITEEENQENTFSQLENTLDDEQSATSEVELYRGTGQLLANSKSSGGQLKRKGEGKYTLNFDQADLGEVAKVIMSDTLGLNYVLHPKVMGTVTLQTSQPLTAEELLPTLEMLLSMNDAVLLREGSVYHIEPISGSLKSSALTIGKNNTNFNSGHQVQVIPLEYVGVLDIVEILTPLITDESILRVDEARNLLFVAGSAKELRYVQDIINTFDVDIMKGMSFGLFPLVHVSPDLIIEELESILNSKEGSPMTGMFRFLAIERMNALMVLTPQVRYLDKIQTWITRLDRANLTSNGGVLVYRVQNVDAEELAETLNSIFVDTSSNQQQRVSLAPGARAGEITNKQQNGENKTRKRSTSASQNNRQSVNVDDLNNVNIIADKINNSLIIVATPQQFEPVMTVVRQLDVMPLQVLIDAMIIEVTLTDDLEYGVQWAIQAGNFNNILADLDGGLLSGARAGLSTIYTGANINAILHALAEKSKLNVIASPSLMVLNNHEASINVGDQVPVATSSSTNTNSLATDVDGDTSSAFVTNNIERIDTGITLIVTPRVNAGGLVVLEIEQEANQVVEGTAGNNNTPTISQRKINSTIAIKNGETVVLGGLIREAQEEIQSGVPILHELPLIGPLFGSTDKTLRKTELVVVITPRVVTNAQDAREITNEFKRKLTGLYEEIQSETNPGRTEEVITTQPYYSPQAIQQPLQ